MLTEMHEDGNHDSQFNLSREDIFKREGRYSNSLTKQMVKTNNSGGMYTSYYSSHLAESSQ